MAKRIVIAFWLAAGLISLPAALSPEQLAKLPPPASRTVNFTADVKPILEASCIKCHGRGRVQGGFAIDTRETILKGGDSGAAIIPGKSAESSLIHLVAGVDPDSVMPKKGSRLTAEQVGVLRAWIDQGLVWDAGITFAKPVPVNLFPRTPELAGSERENPIDRLLAPYLKEHNVPATTLVDDRTYVRRAFLDLIGVIPTPSEVQAFTRSHGKDKRSALVQALLADDRRYAEHWFTFWNDMLRNDYRGTGYIDGGRKQITSWLYNALYQNLPYNKFVAQLINPTPESEGFTKGIIWRGVVNASQTPEMQAAQNISQVFMGVNLKCASCHDSFINDWTLADAYGLASIYSDGPLEMYRCDKPTGKKAQMKFLYSELGTIDPKLPRKERLKQLASLITEKQDGRLTRTIVNRLWARFMGRGLVEPLDDMENKAWSPDLLDWLAEDLATHGYDLKRTIALIATSKAYQMPSAPITEQVEKQFVFKGPLVKRMSAEQYLDALGALTGVWQKNPAAQVSLHRAGAVLDQPVEPKWIWRHAGAQAKAAPETIFVRKEFNLPEQPTEGGLVIACDNEFKVFVNGQEAGSGNDFSKPAFVELSNLKRGRNSLLIQAANGLGSPKDKNAPQENPAGLVFYARIRASEIWRGTKIERVRDFASDASCEWSFNRESGWQPSVSLGSLNLAPWKLETKFIQVLTGAPLREQTRACLVPADSLMVALGRPNREQVITARASAATTLQALELTNGSPLAKLLKDGAEKVLRQAPAEPEKLVAWVYERGLSRKPTPDEASLCADLLRGEPRQEGVEDLLWGLSMLPEFQLIY